MKLVKNKCFKNDFHENSTFCLSFLTTSQQNAVLVLMSDRTGFSKSSKTHKCQHEHAFRCLSKTIFNIDFYEQCFLAFLLSSLSFSWLSKILGRLRTRVSGVLFYEDLGLPRKEKTWNFEPNLTKTFWCMIICHITKQSQLFKDTCFILFLTNATHQC